MKNIISKIAKTIGAGLIIGAIPLLIDGCDPIKKSEKELRGKIINCSFYEAKTGFLSDLPPRYDALIEISNPTKKEILLHLERDEAIKANLRYKEGDSITVKQIKYVMGTASNTDTEYILGDSTKTDLAYRELYRDLKKLFALNPFLRK